VKIHWFKPITSLAKTTIIEEDPKNIPLRGNEDPVVHVGKYSIETYKIH
jgi:hypothetical protein